jgi:predicted TIM-barrel fold metal-dependent hydrolase
MEQQMAMLSMMVNGVYERFPQLRVAYLEGGSAWLPWWLERIEEHFEVARWNEVAGLSLSPTEYFKRNCYVSTDADERLLYQVIEVLGDDRILFPTDYPHPDAKYPGVVDSFLDLPRVGEESKRKILWDNAVAFYGFDEAGLAAPDESTG